MDDLNKDVENFFQGYAENFDAIYGHTKKRNFFQRWIDRRLRRVMRLRFEETLANSVNPDIREDSFTATDARELHSAIDAEMGRERQILRADILAEINLRRYKDEKECEADKRKIRERISVVEQNQEHCMRMLRQHDKVQR